MSVVSSSELYLASVLPNVNINTSLQLQYSLLVQPYGSLLLFYGEKTFIREWLLAEMGLWGACEKSIVATQSRKNNDLLKLRKFYVVERISNEKKPNWIFQIVNFEYLPNYLFCSLMMATTREKGRCILKTYAQLEPKGFFFPVSAIKDDKSYTPEFWVSSIF